MATMPELKSSVAIAIEANYSNRQRPSDYPTLRCSKIGEPCERSLWYDLRWTTPLERHEGRMERLFQTGHREEKRMIEDLRAIGCKVHDFDMTTGKQWRVSFIDGMLTGSADGVVEGVPGAEKTPHLLECKTHNDKSFQDWKRQGVEKSKPMHFFQMQIYMHGLKLERALYLAHNKNTDQVDAQRVNYDRNVALAILEKAQRIVSSDRPPAKNESFACRWCRHSQTCNGQDWTRANCRTCIAFEFGGSSEYGRCITHDTALTLDKQRAGCADHRWIPDLVPGEQIDADPETRKITYELRDGALFVDGEGRKPAAPEVL